MCVCIYIYLSIYLSFFLWKSIMVGTWVGQGPKNLSKRWGFAPPPKRTAPEAGKLHPLKPSL